jgi:putative transposase
LEADITTFIRAHNENPKPCRWVKPAAEILASVKRFCQKALTRTSGSDDWAASS